MGGTARVSMRRKDARHSELLSIMSWTWRGPEAMGGRRISQFSAIASALQNGEALSVDCMHLKPGVQVASLTDVGCQRENNEDSFLYWEPAGEKEFRLKGRLAVIADGMGGHEGGQEASRMAVETVREV